MIRGIVKHKTNTPIIDAIKMIDCRVTGSGFEYSRTTKWIATVCIIKITNRINHFGTFHSKVVFCGMLLRVNVSLGLVDL